MAAHHSEPSPPALVVGVAAAGRMLRTGPKQIRELIHSGEIEAFRNSDEINAAWRISVASLEAYLARRLAEAKERRAA